MDVLDRGGAGIKCNSPFRLMTLIQYNRLWILNLKGSTFWIHPVKQNHIYIKLTILKYIAQVIIMLIY